MGNFSAMDGKRRGPLVAQCSVIGVSVAATPPCSAIGFCKDISPRHSDRGAARWVRQGLLGGGGGGGCGATPPRHH